MAEYMKNHGEPQNLAISFQHGLAGLALAEAGYFRVTGRGVHARRACAYLDTLATRLRQDNAHGWRGSLLFGVGGAIWSAHYVAASGIPVEADTIEAWMALMATDSEGGFDLALGAAGRALVALRHFQAGGRIQWREYAVEQAERIARERDSNGLWTMSLSTTSRFWGFAHGVAGIAYLFLELYLVTGSKRWLELVRDCVDRLQNSVSNVNGAGWQWTHGPDTSLTWCAWCNGNAGISLLFFRLHQLLSEGSDAVNHCLSGVARALWATAPLGQCHGLAGVGQCLREGGAPAEEALEQVDLLLHAATQWDSFGPVWPSDDSTISEDFGVGYPGIAFYWASRLGGLGHPLLVDLPR